jgi:hypothetical protein
MNFSTTPFPLTCSVYFFLHTVWKRSGLPAWL